MAGSSGVNPQMVIEFTASIKAFEQSMNTMMGLFQKVAGSAQTVVQPLKEVTSETKKATSATEDLAKAKEKGAKADLTALQTARLAVQEERNKTAAAATRAQTTMNTARLEAKAQSDINAKALAELKSQLKKDEAEHNTSLKMKLASYKNHLDARVDMTATAMRMIQRQMASAAVGLAGTLTVGAVGKTGFDFNAMLEQNNMAFTVMLNSSTKARELADSFQALQTSTGIGIQEAAEGSKQLLAYGFQFEGMVDNLKMLKTVAGAVNVPLNDLVYVYGTLRSQGRAYTRDLMQFAMRGIPIYESLAVTMGVPVNKLKQMTEEGKVGFEQVKAAMEYMTGSSGPFGGMLEASLNTINGQIKLLGFEWQSFAGRLAKPLMLPIKEAIEDLVVAFRKLDGEPIAGNLGSTLLALMPAVTATAQAFLDLGKVISEYFSKMAPALNVLVTVLMRTISVLSEFAQVLSGPVSAALAGFLTVKLVTPVITAINTLIVSTKAAMAADILAQRVEDTGNASRLISFATINEKTKATAAYTAAVTASGAAELRSMAAKANLVRLQQVLIAEMNAFGASNIRTAMATQALTLAEMELAAALTGVDVAMAATVASEARLTAANVAMAGSTITAATGLTAMGTAVKGLAASFMAFVGTPVGLLITALGVLAGIGTIAFSFINEQKEKSTAYDAAVNSGDLAGMAKNVDLRYGAMGNAVGAFDFGNAGINVKNNAETVAKALDSLATKAKVSTSAFTQAMVDAGRLTMNFGDEVQEAVKKIGAKLALAPMNRNPSYQYAGKVDMPPAAWTTLLGQAGYDINSLKNPSGSMENEQIKLTDEYQKAEKQPGRYTTVAATYGQVGTGLAAETFKKNNPLDGLKALAATFPSLAEQAASSMTTAYGSFLGSALEEYMRVTNLKESGVSILKSDADSLEQAKKTIELINPEYQKLLELKEKDKKITIDTFALRSWQVQNTETQRDDLLLEQERALAAAEKSKKDGTIDPKDYDQILATIQATFAKRISTAIGEETLSRAKATQAMLIQRLDNEKVIFNSAYHNANAVADFESRQLSERALREKMVVIADYDTKMDVQRAALDAINKDNKIVTEAERADALRTHEDNLKNIENEKKAKLAAIDSATTASSTSIDATLKKSLQLVKQEELDNAKAVFDTIAHDKSAIAKMDQEVIFAKEDAERASLDLIYANATGKDLDEYNKKIGFLQKLTSAQITALELKLAKDIKLDAIRIEAAKAALTFGLEAESLQFDAVMARLKVEAESEKDKQKVALKMLEIEKAITDEKLRQAGVLGGNSGDTWIKGIKDKAALGLVDGTQDIQAGVKLGIPAWTGQGVGKVAGSIAQTAGATMMAGTGMAGLGAALSAAGPVGLAVAAASKMADMFASTIGSLESFKEAMDPIGTMVKAAFEPIKDIMNAVFEPFAVIFKSLGHTIGLVIKPFAAVGAIISSFIAVALMPFLVAFQLIGSVFSFIADRVFIPVANSIIGVWNGIVRALNKALGTFGFHMEEMNRILTSAEKLAAERNADAAKKTANAATAALEYLRNKIKAEADKQVNSYKRLWEVGAMSGEDYNKKAAEINEKLNIVSMGGDAANEFIMQLQGWGGTLDDMLSALPGYAQKVSAVEAAAEDFAKNPDGFANATTALKTFATNLVNFKPGENLTVTETPPATTIGEALTAIATPVVTAIEATLAPVATVLSNPVVSGTLKFLNWLFGGGKSHATGTDKVLDDGMAMIHQGEGIVPATFMESIRSGKLSLSGPGGGGAGGIVVNVTVNGSVQTENDLAASIARSIAKQQQSGALRVGLS